MTSELRTKSEEIWNVIRSELENLMKAGEALADIQQFVTQRRSREPVGRGNTLMTLERTVRPTEWGANRGVAEFTVTFGITTTTYIPKDRGDTLAVLAFVLADILMENNVIADVVDDMSIVEVAPDTTPEGMSETTQPWAVVTAAFTFEFLRP